jgi:hypothetical protein
MDWTLGTFGDLRLDKGGRDPRTDDRAQDGLSAPAGREPERRGTGRPVLRQSEGDGDEDHRGLGCPDGCRLRRTARTADRRPERGEVPDHGATPSRPRPGQEGQCLRRAGARDDRGGRCQRVVSRPGGRRCVEPGWGEPGAARPAAAGGAGVGALGGHCPTGEASGAVCHADDGGGRPRGRHLPSVGNGAGSDVPWADPGDVGPHAGWWRYSVCRHGKVPARRATQDRTAGARSRPTQAQRVAGTALWRGGDLPPQGRA